MEALAATHGAVAAHCLVDGQLSPLLPPSTGWLVNSSRFQPLLHGGVDAAGEMRRGEARRLRGSRGRLSDVG